jgi:hypothetical protein
MQAPALHDCAPVQVAPQDPQLSSSLAVFTQTPPHRFCPGGQRQLPCRQVVPPVQAMPQPPQLFESAAGSTQAPPQVRKPLPHAD